MSFPGTNFTTPDAAAEALQSNLLAAGATLGTKLNIEGVMLYALANVFTGTAADGYFARLGGSTFTGALTSSSPTAGIGYATGAGGAVTQATNRTTGVTLNTVTGAITTNNASLAAEAAAEFTVTNSAVAVGDTVVVSQRSGANGGNTNVYVSTVAAGSFKITVANNNAASGTAETGAIIINYAVIKAVSA